MIFVWKFTVANLCELVLEGYILLYYSTLLLIYTLYFILYWTKFGEGLITTPMPTALTFIHFFFFCSRLMTDRLLGLCGSLGRSAPGLVVRGAPVRTYLERGEDLLGLEVTPGVLLSGAAPLAPHANTASVQATANSPLPDIYPIKPTISINTTHFYQDREIYCEYACHGKMNIEC